jgi:hypothetical protein
MYRTRPEKVSAYGLEFEQRCGFYFTKYEMMIGPGKYKIKQQKIVIL